MSTDDFLTMFQSPDGRAALDQEYPFYPLTSMDMPIPGPDFIAHACQLGDDAPVIEGKGSTKYLDRHGKQLEYLYRRALYDANFSIPVMTKGIVKNARVVPGHMLGDVTGGMGGGPRPARVMLLVKQPTKEEMQQSRYLCGAGTDAFQEVMTEVGLSQDEIDGMYVTSVVKWGDQADGGGAIPASHKVDCAVLLEQELRLVRPDFILCLGAEPGKSLLGANGSVSAMVGRCEDLAIETSTPGEPSRKHIAKVMVAASPGAVARSPELYPEFKSQVQQFISLVGGTPVGAAEAGVRHYTVYKLRHLRQIVDELLADPDPMTRIIAVDGEWDGESETEPGAYLRTIQFSARHKESFCVVLRHQGGSDAFKPNPQAAITELKRLLKTDESRGYYPRIGGFWLRADLPWLIREGLDLRNEYAPPDELVDIRDKGGIEASLMIHAHNETASYRLTDVMARLTTCPVYDIKLKEYVAKYCSKHKLKKEDLAGYGMIPSWILHPEPWDPEKPNMYACLHKESNVILPDGSTAMIVDLVKSRYSGDVFSAVGGKVVLAKVTGWHRKAVNQQDWRKIRTVSTLTGKYGDLSVSYTPDHEIITQRGKVRVDQLRPGEDGILTDEKTLSPEGLSVFLASLLGDGGLAERNKVRRGIWFSQHLSRSGYCDWKAESLAVLAPSLVSSNTKRRQYVSPYSKYITWLAGQYPRKEPAEHAYKKLIITPKVLAAMGDIGLAVWYQDDGCLVKSSRGRRSSGCRIAASKLRPGEIVLALQWLTDRLGEGVSYNAKQGFFQFVRQAFATLQTDMAKLSHPDCQYKFVNPVTGPPTLPQGGGLFVDPILEVVNHSFSHRAGRGHGVRYCLSVAETGNFLTTDGFVSNCLDADVTRRIIIRCIEPGGLLDRDSYGNSSWEPYWIAHRASLGVLEMEMEGIALDRDRVDELTTKYMNIYESLIQNFRTKIGWVDFNPNSSQQCVALLFGQMYVRSAGNNTIKQVLPDGVLSLGLTPVKTTGKKAKLWEDVVTRRQQHLVSVSTDKEVLGVLGAKHPLAMMLRDIKFVAQILKGPLRAPIFAEDGSGFELDGENLVYEKGLAGSMTPDGKVHTHISQHKETGRYASARPALQNISSRREADYERICGTWYENADGVKVRKGAYLEVFPEPQYTKQIRSIFKADPGTLFVEADVTGAELAAIAWAAQDPTMIEHVRRNLLPEKHPEHYDIHSNMAVKAFKLDCEPNKAGLKSVNALHLRIGAKAVIFGVPYGRGAEAIVRQLKEEGVYLTITEAEDIIRGYFELYPQVGDLLQACRQRTQTERWMAGAFGRYRRFIRSTDKQVIGEQERQGCNFGIQNCVADAVSVAISNFYNYKKANHNCGFSLLLQIHDALLFKVRIDAMLPFCKDTYSPDGTILHRSILRRCMIDQVPIFPRYLDNTPIPVAQPYFFGTDMDICENWGETIANDRLVALGLSELISE